jgi:hypothetical protein
MAPIIEGPPEGDKDVRPLSLRLLWFAALWIGGAGVMALVAYTLRALIMPPSG